MSGSPVSTLPELRRIVTGHVTGTGASTVQSDTAVAWWDVPGFTGAKGAAVWTTAGVPGNDNNTDIDGATRELPESTFGLVLPKGANVRMNDLAPETDLPLHRTLSVDFNILISGELILITDDGTEKHIKTPGDVIVQRGTLHAWRNPGKTWTRWATVLLDADPVVVDGKVLTAEVKV